MPVRNSNMPRRGQGNKPIVPVSIDSPKEEIQEEINVCIDKEIPPEMVELASELAIAENCENIPLVPFGSDFVNPKKMAMLTGKKWQPGRVIKCAFLAGDSTVHEKVKYWAKQWEQYANIKFDFIDDVLKSEVRIAFNKNDGSWSYLGTDILTIPKDKPTMNLGWLEANTSDKEYSRVVLHEFGHTLGCIHEHQHPEAGIPWDVDAVYKYYTKGQNGWTKAQVDTNIFGKYSVSITQFSNWDSTSIMSYAVPKSLTGGKLEIPWNTTLSETDKKFVAQMYPFPANKESTSKYIKKIYLLVLGRQPKSDELDNNLSILNNKGRIEFVSGLEKSSENSQRISRLLYLKYLGRASTIDEDKVIKDYIHRDMTEEQLITYVLSSNEYIQKSNNDNTSFIKNIAKDLLGRSPTDNELSSWNLNATLLGKPQLISNILSSKEFRANTIKAYYKSILSREGMVAEINAWVNSSIDVAKIRYSIESSQELFNNS